MSLFCRTMASRHRENGLIEWKDSEMAKSIIASFYGIDNAFDWSCVFSRDCAFRVGIAPFSTIRTINTGVKLFEQNNRLDECPFRLCQEGLGLLVPHMTRRVIPLDVLDFIALFPTRINPAPITSFSASVQVGVASLLDIECVERHLRRVVCSEAG